MTVTTTTVRKLIVRQHNLTLGIIATPEGRSEITPDDVALADNMVTEIGEGGYYDLVLRIDGKNVDESIEIN